MAPRKPVRTPVRQGFKANRTIYNLVFDDPHSDVEGLVVRIRRGSIAEREAYDDIETDLLMLEFYASIIVEWNVEGDDGELVPITVDGLRSLEDTTFIAIQRAWIQAGREVSAPLEQPSSDGAPSLEAQIPMEPLSESRAS